MAENLNKEKTLSNIDKKLSIVISLLLRLVNNSKEATLKEQISDLASFGLNSSEIADIVGKKIGHVSKELSELKKIKK
jgi:hypothetical protein